MTSTSSCASSGSRFSPLSSPAGSECSPSGSLSSPTLSVVGDDVAGANAIRTLVAELHGYEAQLRAVYASAGRLAIAAAVAQESNNLSPTCGHRVLAAIGASSVEVVDALGQAARAHELLETLGRKLGLDTTAYGDTYKEPKTFFLAGGEGAVAAA